MKAVLADYATAPISPEARATLALLEQLTLTPDSVTAADVQAVRDAGVSDEAIEDALHIQAAFNILDRLADAFQFAVPDQSAFAAMAKMLLKRGYL